MIFVFHHYAKYPRKVWGWRSGCNADTLYICVVTICTRVLNIVARGPFLLLCACSNVPLVYLESLRLRAVSKKSPCSFHAVICRHGAPLRERQRVKLPSCSRGGSEREVGYQYSPAPPRDYDTLCANYTCRCAHTRSCMVLMCMFSFFIEKSGGVLRE